jgi:acyl-CoA thioester hydrolase
MFLQYKFNNIFLEINNYLMKKTTTKLKIRYSETDQMGVVHHGNYAQFFEIGRLDWINKLGISYKKMESEGVLLPVLSLEVNFIKSAYYDDEIVVHTYLIEKPTAKIKFEYEIYNSSNELITTAKTELVFVSKKNNKPIRCPNYFLERI